MSKQPLLDDETNGAADVAAHLEAGLGDGDVSPPPAPTRPWSHVGHL